MPKLIDKRETIRLIQDRFCSECYTKGECDGCEYKYCIEAVEDTPTIEAEPIRHGRWIVHTLWHGMFGLIHSECSECKFDRNGDLSSWKFCPNCGVRMDGGSENG